MEEIKFRAWDGENNRMVYWTLNDLLCRFGEGEYKDDRKDCSPFFIWMQFIGLHDQVGKEIYEGDIVSTATKENCEIIYMDKWAGFASHRKSEIGEHYSPLSIINHPERYPLEVIGNIYEDKI